MFRAKRTVHGINVHRGIIRRRYAANDAAPRGSSGARRRTRGVPLLHRRDAEIERSPVPARLYPVTVIRESRIVSCGNDECLYQPASQHEQFVSPVSPSPPFLIPCPPLPGSPVSSAAPLSSSTYLVVLYRRGSAAIDNQRVFAEQIASSFLGWRYELGYFRK